MIAILQKLVCNTLVVLIKNTNFVFLQINNRPQETQWLQMTLIISMSCSTSYGLRFRGKKDEDVGDWNLGCE